ncbi:MAG: hypothetical protein K2X84_15960 [Beijerinckiaceae bacterium]|nr:hypothetical protein [Beijerinckiaceae bacterium]
MNRPDGISFRDLVRELAIAAFQATAIAAGLLALAAFTFAMPLFLGIALGGLR